MKEQCENQLCENKPLKEVPVSIRTPSDQMRSLCTNCEEAYSWGVQHGEMIAEHRTLWILAVADKGIIAFVRAFNSEVLAKKGLVAYLREYERYDGSGDIGMVYDWLREHDECLSIEIVQQDAKGNMIEFGFPKS